jgi:hypothetical protein
MRTVPNGANMQLVKALMNLEPSLATPFAQHDVPHPQTERFLLASKVYRRSHFLGVRCMLSGNEEVPSTNDMDPLF